MAITDPLDLADCILWLDASQETYADLDPVPIWTDRSGAGNHAVQGTVSRQPTFRTARPCVEFGHITLGAPNDSLILPGIFNIGAGSTFMVGRDLTHGGVILSAGDLSGPSDRRFRWYFISEPTTLLNASGPNTYTASAAWGTSFATDYKARAWGFGSNGATVKVERRCSVNNDSGTDTFTGSVPGYTGTAATPATLGRINGVDTQHWHGLLAEVVHYNRFVTSTEWDDVMDYLEAKWSVGCESSWTVGSIPSDVIPQSAWTP